MLIDFAIIFAATLLNCLHSLSMEPVEISVKVVGDPGVGKTNLLTMYSCNHFIGDWIPCDSNESHLKKIEVNNISVYLYLFDSAGQSDYDRLRPLGYPDKDLFIICFAVDNPDSFENVRLKWLPELKHYVPNKPILLLGTKSDLIEEQNAEENEKNTNAGRRLAKEIRAIKYFECSALKYVGLEEVFKKATKVVLQKRNKCTIS